MDTLLVLLFLLVLITLLGHGIWLVVRAVFRWLAGPSPAKKQPQTFGISRCPNCNYTFEPDADFCGQCGFRKPSGIVVELLKDLAATERQLERFHRSGAIDDQEHEKLSERIQLEKARLGGRKAQPVAEARSQPPSITESVFDETAFPSAPPSAVNVTPAPIESTAVFEPEQPTVASEEETYAPAVRSEPRRPPPEPIAPPRPRKPFSEVLASFMEQSNIRWGEIVGGLLIIGCSTALVISLWAQISRIPVLKFLIFTTVTAALFGVGLYTQHRWKLPTTSHGILTIATLLVPLNFLAIAAVSASTIPPGMLVIGSELIAPALFLCLVYFAGRVLTSKWPHLLAAGVLGSSVGQLLIRHFASPDNSPELLLLLGAFPVICYAATTAWMLRIALSDEEIDESETNAIFATLGATTFATLLPFGLLLYKSGPVSMSMMYLAPLVTLGGVPMLASGTLLWRRATKRELGPHRTAGTSIAIAGTMMVLAGMILAWPNPASVVPAALLNFVIFTALAILLNISVAHIIAAICLTLAWVILFHVLAGHTPWQNLRVVSLLDVTQTISTGQALAVLFVLFLAVSEWWTRRKREADGTSYLIVACMIAVISSPYFIESGVNEVGDPHAVRAFYALYAIGAFWIAWRRNLPAFCWVGSVLLLASLAQALGPWLDAPFPWQAALLMHATISAIAAISLSLTEESPRALFSPLNRSALITSFVAVVCLAQAAGWEPAAMQSRRVFWLAMIWLALLWLNRKRALLISFKVALTLALVLAIKALLQHYDWYTAFPYGSLHPWSLQLQGSALVLLSIGWVTLRLYVKHITGPPELTEHTAQRQVPRWLADASRLLEEPNTFFGRPVLWAVLGGFVVLAIYGALSGVRQELTPGGLEAPTWNIGGFQHQYAYGAGSWILLALLVIAFLANLWEGRRRVYLLGAFAAATMVSPLLAGAWEAQIAMASAWRYLAAMVLILGLVAVWFRDEIWAGISAFGWPALDNEVGELARDLRVLLLGSTLTPLLALTIYPLLRAIYYRPVHGPASGFFASLDDGLSYSVPLVVSGLVLIGLAVRDQLVPYVFSAGLLFNLTISTVYLFAVVAVRGDMNRVVLAQMIQLNTIVSVLYAILWLSARVRWEQALTIRAAVLAQKLFKIQLGIAIAGIVAVLIPVAIHLIITPRWTGAGTAAADGLYGWVAFFLTAFAAFSFSRAYPKRLGPGSLCALLVAISCLLAFSASRSAPQDWRAFNVLMFALAAAAWLMCLARALPSFVNEHSQSFLKRIAPSGFTEEWTWNTVLFTTALGFGTVLLALRAGFDDAGSAWWSITALLAMSALAGVLNWQSLQRPYLYAAGVLVSVATVIWLVSFPARPFRGIRFVEVNVITLCSSSLIWLWLELRARRVSQPKDTSSNALSFHNVAALLSLTSMGLIAWILLFDQATGAYVPPHSAALNWFAFASLAVLMFACLWDKDASYALAGLYLLGLLAAALALEQLRLLPRYLGWAAMIVMATYTVITGLVWRQRERLIAWASNLKIPARLETEVTELKWLQVFNAFLIFFVVWLGYWINLRFYELALRITGALAITMQAFTLVLVGGTVRRANWQRAAFAVFTLGVVAFGWAWLTPGITGTWLNRAVILMVEMFAIVALFGLELDKALRSEPEWTRSIRDCVPWLTAAGIISLIFVLSIEVYYQIQFGAVRIKPLALLTIGVTLIAATISCVLFALSPKHDPLNLSEEHRRQYVYAAEAMLALLFMHIRLTMPWLFTGFFERYWPMVVVAVAYLGVAASELLRRRNVMVLAHPIERTGVFLPLLPVLGFWRLNSEVDYSVLLFIVGGLYGLLSILRRSFLWGMLAALAGNGGFWYVWYRTEQYGFLEHPQLWLIPAACSVLIAAYLNRDDFSDEQMIGIRYLALMTIYVSSTADIFINGVANSPWLPMILAALSVAGVLCGIMFRIRAFLILGCVFLLLAITTMIYYASANLGWTWLWYVAGIITGAMIIFTFAVFEKKKEEMLRLVEGLKEWQQ